jgi:hypothetical protein
MLEEHKMNLQTLENLSLQPAQMRDRHINAIYEGMAENGAFLANGLENSAAQVFLIPLFWKTSENQIIADLTRAKCVFQLATVCAVIRGGM